MAKSTLQAIASAIAERHGLKGDEAMAFVNLFFNQICEGLARDKLVKVRGLGTFKFQSVKARESVNVNTGERVVINGHDKIVFTPDNAMKGLVNRPFADFETVVIKDGTDLDSIPTPEDASSTDEENNNEALNGLKADSIQSPMEAKKNADAHDFPSSGTADTAISKEERAEEQVSQAVSGVNRQSQESTILTRTTEVPTQDKIESDTEKTASHSQSVVSPTRKLTPSERFSQLMGDGQDDKEAGENLSDNHNSQDETCKTVNNSNLSPKSTDAILDNAKQESTRVKVEEKDNTQTEGMNTSTNNEIPPKTSDGKSDIRPTTVTSMEKEDGIQDDEKTSPNHKKPHVVRNLLLTITLLLLAFAVGLTAYFYCQEKEDASQTSVASKTSKPQSPSHNRRKSREATQSQVSKDTIAESRSTENLKKGVDGNRMKLTPEGINLQEANNYPKLRYGAYYIVGVERSIVLRHGDTMEKVCKRTLGKDMIGYFEAINGTERHTVGDTILIPKVELRPEYRK